jgi:hypothetical protein
MGTDIHAVFQAKKDGTWIDIESTWSQDRQYSLFAWLGNVRNGYGFAGISTHQPIKPLSDNRGVPDGFEWDGEWHHEFWLGDHSHSWLLGEEILSILPPSLERTGYISIEEFKNWDRVSPPPNGW